MKRWMSMLMILSVLLAGCSWKHDATEATEAPKSFLVGTWKSVVDNTVVTFREDGTCSLESVEITASGHYVLEGSIVHTNWGDMEIGTFCDVRCLIHLGRINEYGEERIYVSQEDYSKVAPEEIPITMENWNTYFEIRQLRHVYGSETDGYMAIFILGVCLKNEYLDRLCKSRTDISFEVCRDVYHCDIEDPLGEPKVSNLTLTKQGHTTTARVRDWREMTENHPLDEANDYYCALINSGFAVWDNHIYIEKDGQVTETRGSLWLYPAGAN